MSLATCTVRRHLRAPAAALFETIVDPQRFTTVRGVHGVEVLREGADGPLGVGTLRKVRLTAGFLVEEIVDLETGTRFDYLIRDAAVPVDHRFGRIEFRDRGTHTEATWTSTLAFDQPVIGRALGHGAVVAMRLAFFAALGEVDRAARHHA